MKPCKNQVILIKVLILIRIFQYPVKITGFCYLYFPLKELQCIWRYVPQYSTVWPFLDLDNSPISDINNFGFKSEKKHHFDIPRDFVVCGILLQLRYINVYLPLCCGQWNRCPCPCLWSLLFWFWQHQKTNTLASMPLLYVTMVCFMETFCISISSANM